ncbi:MAG: hypothetical protein RL095_664 [Verrucomicrobiota bacterium]|jgi:hypothetical protein
MNPLRLYSLLAALVLAGLAFFFGSRASACWCGADAALIPDPQREVIRCPILDFDENLKILCADIPVEEKSILCNEGQDDYAERFLAAETELIRQGGQNEGQAILLYQQICGLRDLVEATKLGEGLFALPEAQRRQVSVLAAYRLCRLACREKDATACDAWGARCRTLAKAGFPDPLGLAAATWGWSAQIRYRNRDFAEAMELYLKHSACGDPSAILSCRMTADEILKIDDEAAFQKACAEPRCLALVLLRASSVEWSSWGYSLSSEDEDSLLRFTLKLDRILKDNPKVAGAGFLALALYRFGRYQDCERLAEKEPDSVLSQWLLAKLAMRRGDIATTSAQYQRLLKMPLESLRIKPNWRDKLTVGDEEGPARSEILAEDALIQLHHGHYQQALRQFVEADFLLDAAFVAERILSTDELKAFVQSLPEELDDAPIERSLWVDELCSRGAFLRLLLAKRLVRDDRYDEALEFHRGEEKLLLQKYAELLKTGRDAKLPKSQRAEAFWQAAEIAKTKGLELMGTWLGPDGDFAEGNFIEENVGIWEASGRCLLDEKEMEIVTDTLRSSIKDALKPSADELARIQRHAPTPNRRYHYRCIAVKLAIEACSLMPDGHELGRHLVIANSWDGNDDGYDFHGELMKRCQGTVLRRVVYHHGMIAPRHLENLAALDPWPAHRRRQFWQVAIAVAALGGGLFLLVWLWRRRKSKP